MTSAQWLFVLVAGIQVSLSAQPVQSSLPAFEAASIKKRATPVQGFQPLIAEHGTFSTPGTSVAFLVQFAYDVKDYFIVDAPNWIRTDVFEVNAKAGRDATRAEMQMMMQSLLAERFGLVIRREPRVLAHFALVPAREDGAHGPTLQQIDDCRNREIRPKEPTVPPGAALVRGCGTMSALATMASGHMRAPVIDKTGIAGTFRYVMYISPADAIVDIPGLPSLRPRIGPEADALPSFRDAMRDQLGLRMESARGPLEVLVIQSVHQPTDN